jgi:protein-tyrosine phosphatase
VPAPFEILVVCVGNQCRSPLAERLMSQWLTDALAGSERVRVASAGTGAAAGAPMDPHAAAELRRLGGDPSGFVSRGFQPGLADQADLVLTATKQLRSRVLEESPRALRRTFTIREIAGLLTSSPLRSAHVADPVELVSRAAELRGSVKVSDLDIPDPIGRSAEVHRKVADLIAEDCWIIVRALRVAFRDGMDESAAASDPPS